MLNPQPISFFQGVSRIIPPTVPLTFGNFNGTVWDIQTLSNGKFLVGGSFTSYTNSGSVTPVTVGGICRLNIDGTLDTSFNNAGSGVAGDNDSGATAGAYVGTAATVYTICVHSNGSYYVGGNFTSYNGTALPANLPCIIKLDSNGNRDTAFNGSNGVQTTTIQRMASNTANYRANPVYSIIDGLDNQFGYDTIVCGGRVCFTDSTGPTYKNGISKLNATDGSPAPTVANTLVGNGTSANTVTWVRRILATPSYGDTPIKYMVVGNFNRYNDGTLSTVSNAIRVVDSLAADIAGVRTTPYAINSGEGTFGSVYVDDVIQLPKYNFSYVFGTSTGVPGASTAGTLRARNYRGSTGPVGGYPAPPIAGNILFAGGGVRKIALVDTGSQYVYGTTAGDIANYTTASNILVGGEFLSASLLPAERIAKYTMAGTQILTFSGSGLGFEGGGVYAVQPMKNAQQYVVGGAFTSYSSSVVTNRIAGLNISGALQFIV